MVRCIVLDGWHKGHMVTLPEVLPRLSLLKPKTITIDDCCDGDVVGVDRDLRKDYYLAFVSIDRRVALYSIDGKPDSFFADRNWVVPADKNWVEQPLYVGIHDPRSVIDYSTVGDA